MLKMKIKDSGMFRQLLNATDVLLSEVLIKASSAGLKVRGMDPSRVAMIDLEIPSTFFEEYSCDEETEILVDVSELLKLLRRSGKDEIEITYPQETGDFNITFLGQLKTRKFSFPALKSNESDLAEVPLPKITFNASAKVVVDDFRDALEDTNLVSDFVRIIVDVDKLVLNATGDLLSANVELQKGGESVLELTVKDPSSPTKVTLSLNYIIDVFRAGNLTDLATIEAAADMPLKITFHLKQEGLKLEYYLAPRIEVD